MRDEFQNDNNNNHNTDDSRASSASSAAVVSVDAAGPDHMVPEHQPVACASCMRSANVDVYSARPQRVERFPAYRR